MKYEPVPLDRYFSLAPKSDSDEQDFGYFLVSRSIECGRCFSSPPVLLG